MSKDDKKDSTAIEVREREQALAALPEAFLGGAGLSNGEADELLMPVAAVYQATSEEATKYEGLKLGDLYDKTSGQKLPSAKFVPVRGRVVWTRFDEGVDRPIYTHEDYSLVPVEDRDAIRDDGRPLVQKQIEYLLLFEGQEMPHLFRFKSTGYNAGKTINTYDMMRGAKRQGPGFYELTGRQDKQKGGTFWRLSVRTLGDPPADMLTRAAEFYMLSEDMGAIRTADEHEQATGEGARFADDDGIPI